MPTQQCRFRVNILLGAPSSREVPAESKSLRKHELGMKAFFFFVHVARFEQSLLLHSRTGSSSLHALKLKSSLSSL